MRLNPIRKVDPPAYPALDDVVSSRRGFLQKLGLVAGAVVAGALVAGCEKTSGEPPAPAQVGGTPQPPAQIPPVEQATPPEEHAAGGKQAPEMPIEPEPPMERMKGDYVEPERMKPPSDLEKVPKSVDKPVAPK